MKNVIGKVTNPVVQGLLFGLVGGIIGLLANAVLIDVFEASKVAESMWLLLGIGMGAGGLYYKKKVNYKPDLMAFFTSRILIFVYLMVLIFIFFGAGNSNKKGSFWLFYGGLWIYWVFSTTVHLFYFLWWV